MRSIRASKCCLRRAMETQQGPVRHQASHSQLPARSRTTSRCQACTFCTMAQCITSVTDDLHLQARPYVLSSPAIDPEKPWPKRDFDNRTTYGTNHGHKPSTKCREKGYCELRAHQLDSNDYGIHGKPHYKVCPRAQMCRHPVFGRSLAISQAVAWNCQLYGGWSPASPLCPSVLLSIWLPRQSRHFRHLHGCSR